MRLVLAAGCLLATLSAFSQRTAIPLPKGTIVYQRSDADVGKQAVSSPGTVGKVKSSVTDEDRRAVVFTAYTLDVRLQPEDHAIAVRAQITMRNDGDHPLQQVPMQISSTLHWELIRGAGPRRDLPFAQTMVESDADHTGSLNEAAVVLSQPLAPAASLTLDVIYSGQINLSAQRLRNLGTPTDISENSDWDRVAPDFIGLRGFGNVAWYPVASVPVRLGDGDKLFEEIGRVKLRQAAAMVSIKVSDEAKSEVPDVAILNGTVVPVSIAAGTEQATLPSLVSCSLSVAPLGFQTLSLFLAQRHHQSGNGTDVYTRPEDLGSADTYISAASIVTPLLRTWLGNQPNNALTILDLPSHEDAAFEERQTLYAGLQSVSADQLTEPLSHSLAHAYFVSPRPWLNEGVAQFMATLWTEQSKSRKEAVDQLNAQRAALALAEPGSDAVSPHGGLLMASDAIFYRTKAAYVLWMLRSMVGDDAMQTVLKAYDSHADVADAYFETLVSSSAKIAPVETAGTAGGAITRKDLHQFFEDWVYNDRGLPDLSITGVYTSTASAPNTYLVAVNVANSGSASAMVPVTITSGTTQVTERMLVPGNGTATRRILIQDEPVQVQVNDGIVPETEASEHVQRIHYKQASTP